MHIKLKALLSELTQPNQTLSSTRIFHALIIKNRLSQDPFYATKIVRFYAINNDLISARNLFDETPQRSIYLWNSIIRAYAQSHKFHDAFMLFKHLLISETRPDNYTFACVARACAERSDIKALRILHGKLVGFGLELDFICSSALVNCYSKLGLIDEASFVFRGIDKPDLVLWNAMISGYGSCGDWTEGIELFNTMLNTGMWPDGYTMVGLITGLADHSLLKVGETIHGFSVKCGLVLNDHVASVLVSLYSRCKNMESACRVFDSLIRADLISWSALIAGFSQAGDYVKALSFFRELIMNGPGPDPILLATVLSASAQLVTVGPGSEIHAYAIRHECSTEVLVSSALIDMYAKCGFLGIGVKVFENMPKRNIVSYNSVISSLGLYGRAPEAFHIFEKILEEGLKPDETTFVGLLSACCHAGLVNEGRKYFTTMKRVFRIEAKTEHYIHMVKLLGMDGQLKEAYDLIKSVKGRVDVSVWGAFLSCCNSHKNYEFLEVIAKHVLENESKDCRYSVMLSNLLAGDGRWDDVKQLRGDNGGAKGKMPGISWISDMSR
ncbi:hypothetical protein BUALT_Bualt07G0022500 [Buddleja alternifolia]|uniref:Pentatricopeptide repeat-containing protein At1g64310 n=1 Tax=Buddleja alternifolia TaxID=168488 RepID=A0AAV6XFA0_9LAMI|nr:hypothetical protein BUALT_Bualt07G0022500 [Buddleja alternifolia]